MEGPIVPNCSERDITFGIDIAFTEAFFRRRPDQIKCLSASWKSITRGFAVTLNPLMRIRKIGLADFRANVFDGPTTTYFFASLFLGGFLVFGLANGKTLARLA